jgi:hypothetical protein
MIHGIGLRGATLTYEAKSPEAKRGGQLSMSNFFAKLRAAFGLDSSSASADAQRLTELRSQVRALLDEQHRDYEQRAESPAYAETAPDVLLGLTYAEEALRDVDAITPPPRSSRWLTLLLRALDEKHEQLRKHAIDEYGYASATLHEVRAKAAELKSSRQ